MAAASTTAKAPGRKKKKISKHVLQAREKQQDEQPAESAMARTTPKKRKQKKNRNVKDPSEAVQYLSDWQASQSSKEVVWKFNKNTQHWLFRHMYQVDILPKHMFEIMLDYIKGYQSKEGRTRLQSDAARRALRYENNQTQQPKQEGKNKEEDESSSKKPEEGGADVAEKKTPDEQGDDDLARWNKLNDHDKRKEYKRARKVLELLKEMAMQ